MHPLLVPFLLLPLLLPAHAGSIQQGNACNPLNTHLNPANKQLTGDCDSTAFCSSNTTGYDLPQGSAGVCRPKGCRRDEYPFGYDSSSYIPPRCGTGQFCPDEEDSCQPLLALGSPCQLNRDDECLPPASPLAEQLSSERNVDGAICLNFQCLWANVSLGQGCEVENTVYTGYYPGGGTFYDVVSRDNCATGGYCDGVQRVCMPTADVGGTCSADKECDSYNCLPTSLCGPPADSASTVPAYIWVALALGIFLCALLTTLGLYVVHRRQRARQQRQREEYWAEQDQYREVLARARGSLQPALTPTQGGLGGQGWGRYRDDPREGQESSEGSLVLALQAQGESRGSAESTPPGQRRRRSGL
ncbi:hypothetical protein CALVIDRAFT_503437 [Calocera viscosa TUFC12733]|uniref:Uncharacterized protein n=1 Tax=Calocera viscosa (strain TUFC12733) TaxID=1330018 RepID=A0A167IZC8_CALVF|nr:hypothetical protein CALVIDRAFT_503437 [Calocera viscosa TUFC12733]